jgi:hypothetical protein
MFCSHLLLLLLCHSYLSLGCVPYPVFSTLMLAPFDALCPESNGVEVLMWFN